MSRKLTKEKALQIWASDNYIYINKNLAGHNYKKTDMFIDYIEWNKNMYKISEIIKMLINSMLPFNYFRYENCFYRGEVYSLLTESSYNRETFTSVCSDYQQALMFSESNVMFKITIDPEVFCIPTGIENELLIEPNVHWKYLGREGCFYLVHILPFNPNIKNYGNLIDEIEETYIKENDQEIFKLQTNLQNNSFNDVGNIYDFILNNIEFFNVDEKRCYNFDDFKADIRDLNIKTGLANLELLFEFYKSKI